MKGPVLSVEVRADGVFWNKGQKKRDCPRDISQIAVTEVIRREPRFIFPESGAR